MATLTGQQIKDTFKGLLKLIDSQSVSGSLKQVTDGEGTATPLSLSTTRVKSTVDVEASGFKTPTGTSADYLMADGSISSGALGDQNYVHNQGGASSSWTVNHNLGKFPSVFVVDSGNNVVVGEIQYTNTNSLTVSFTATFSGKAYIN
jgi:hypothetical protein